MAYVTVWCVQTYRNQGRGLERARLTSYGRPDLAMTDWVAASGRVPAAAVYEIEVDAALRQVGRVRLLSVHGPVPALA